MLSFVLIAAIASSPFEAADQAYKSGDYDHARTLYQSALRDTPSNALAWYHLAVSDLKTHHDKDALDAIRSFENIIPVPAISFTTNTQFTIFASVPGFESFVAELTQKQYPCRFGGPARAMDRWIGKWNVTNARGAGGTSRIERIFDGCTIEEHWTGEYGERGTSLTYYDTQGGHWVQHYVSDRAIGTDYVGTASENKVVFVASGPQPQARTRMTYTFLGDGRVEQQFESSTDDGNTYAITSDLYYTKAP